MLETVGSFLVLIFHKVM